ncbi:MAG: MlaE family ABC transporter permease [Gammaproteobacteria bacterium]
MNENLNNRQSGILYKLVENTGRGSVRGIEELGYVFMLFLESIYWLFAGKALNQPVKIPSVFKETMAIGFRAIPIVAILSFAVGVMLAIQSIATLRVVGAESMVVMGIALSVTREFSPLIVGILVAGRSGSAIAARIGTMRESQEIDALRVIGIDPVRFLASPLLAAMLIAVPSLTILGDFMGLFGGAIFTSSELDMTLMTYMERTLDSLYVDDIRQGLIKSAVFATIIVLIGAANGFQVHGGAEGIGRATTRAVVLSISFIVLADMIFTYFMNR